MQMSLAASTQVLVSVDGEQRSVAIGELIDHYLPTKPDSADSHDVASVKGIQCVGVSPTETVAWADVTHVSRHPANGDVVTVTTSHGRVVRATASHSFLVREGNRVVCRRGSELVLGDGLPIIKDMPQCSTAKFPDSPVPLTHGAGRLVGVALSCEVSKRMLCFSSTDRAWASEILNDRVPRKGIYVKSHLDDRRDALGQIRVYKVSIYAPELCTWILTHFSTSASRMTSRLPAWILDAPIEFVAGLLQTYFDEQGDVGLAWLRCSASADLGTMLSLCLARFGIRTGLETNRISIPQCSVADFQERIGFSIGSKVIRLTRLVRQPSNVVYIPGMEHIFRALNINVERLTWETLMLCHQQAVRAGASQHLLDELDQAINANVWWDKIVSIQVEASDEMVYDFTVDESLQSFMLTNGMFVHNTLNT